MPACACVQSFGLCVCLHHLVCVCLGTSENGYLRVCDGGVADASIDRGPGACSEDTGEEGVEVPRTQASAVPLDPIQVPLNQGLPQTTIA